MKSDSTRLLQLVGFHFGASGPHAARTMMLEELRLTLRATDPMSDAATYATAIIDNNILAKPSRKSRELSLRHLRALYGLDLANPIFRALRRLWDLSEAAQPMLALSVATARDTLLRKTQDYVLGQPVGARVEREAIEKAIEDAFPDRFGSASLKSFAQNIAGSWTAAQLLEGKVRKVRIQPAVSPESLAMLLFLGYLEGRTGQRLFGSCWTDLLCTTPNELESLAASASNRGLLVFLNAGGIKEVRFPGYLTPDEDRVRQEVANVF